MSAAPPEPAPPAVLDVKPDTATRILELVAQLADARSRRDVRAEHCAITELVRAGTPLCGFTPRFDPGDSTKIHLSTGALELTRDEDGVIVVLSETSGRDAAGRLSKETAGLTSRALIALFAGAEKP